MVELFLYYVAYKPLSQGSPQLCLFSTAAVSNYV